MFNKLFRRALSAGILLGLVLVTGCGSNGAGTSGSITADASRKVKIVTAPSGSGSSATTPTTTTTTAASQTILALAASDQIPGLADIPSSFPFASGVVPSWDCVTSANGAQTCGQPAASAKPDVVGAFRFECGAGQLLRDDPIAFPGQPGASHLHQFYGNLGANASSTFQSLRTSGLSTCGGSANPLNRSGYWTPAMLDGKGNVVRPDLIAEYYKRRPVTDPIVSDPTNAQFQGYAQPMPNGIRWIVGFDMNSGSNPQAGSTYWNCTGPGSVPGHYPDIPTALTQGHCTVGDQLLAITDAPDCWDGKNLDSADHRSHVAYAGYGSWGYLKCPAGYPFVIPVNHLAVFYSIAAGDDPTKWSLSSDSMYPSLPAGSTLHSDFFAAHDNVEEATWTAACINQLLTCSGGDLGNGQQLDGEGNAVAQWNGTAFTHGWTANPHLVPIPQ